MYWVGAHHRFYRSRLSVLLFLFISAEPAATNFDLGGFVQASNQHGDNMQRTIQARLRLYKTAES